MVNTKNMQPPSFKRVPARVRNRLKKNKPRRPIPSSHKIRSELFKDSATYPFRDASANRIAKERRRAKRQLSSMSTVDRWKLIGPTNIGGRMTCGVTDPSDPDRIWAGAAGGGVWFSPDAGVTWDPQWHQEETLNIGSLAIDPNNADIIYCGTGEANLSADSYAGVGLYKTENGGADWNLIAQVDGDNLPSRIGAIEIDPSNSEHLWLGGVGHNFPNEPPEGRGGLYESFDAGVTWRRHDFISSNEYRCHSIVIHPTKPHLVYVTITEQGSKNGIWRTSDGGTNWVHLSSGLPPSSWIERTTLALAPSNPKVIYALSSDKSSRVLGVFRSSDGGDNWDAIHQVPANDPDTHGTAFHYSRRAPNELYENQMQYGNTIVVDPASEDHVICGGVDLHLTTDGGQSWTLVTRWDSRKGDKGYAHADHHALLMPAGAPGRVYSLNDGGVDVSDDGGTKWINRSEGLAVTMYYDLDVAQGNTDYFGGGAQDNGTPLTFSGGADDHVDVTSGDGGWVVFDPQNENHLYTSIYNMTIFRWPHSNPNSRFFEDVSPPASSDERGRVWMCFIAMDPQNSNRVFTGSNRVWRTDDDGATWLPVSPMFNDIITAIEVSRADPSQVYVGTRSGAFHRSADGGNSWSGDLSGATVPNFKISRIKTRPDDANELVAVVANFGVPHVFRSSDGGFSWSDIDNNNLPDVPHRSIAIPANHPNEIYIANDAGVWMSPDFGASWRDLTGHLPNAGIVDIVYNDTTNLLTAATYGRGIWQVKIR